MYERGTSGQAEKIISAFGSRALQQYGLLQTQRDGRRGYYDPEPIPLRPENVSRKARVLDTGFTGSLSAIISSQFGDKMNIIQKLYSVRSSPARVRARALAGVWNPAVREQTTGVCEDSYWTTDKKSLEFIFPWTTLQFLYVNSLSAYASAYSKGNKKLVSDFDAGEWTHDFLNPLKEVYSAGGEFVPPLNDTGKTGMLSDLSFTQSPKIPLCVQSLDRDVATPILQHGVNAIYSLYEAHVLAVTTILNNLIVVLKDPDTNTETVRLHTKVTQGTNDASTAYVTEQAAAARKAIAAFYVNIEREYVNAVVQVSQSQQERNPPTPA